MRKAEEIKRDADRLAQLKQYQTAIEEYNKALEFYPYKGNEQDLFKNAAEFLFKCNYNMAACHSYLDNFDAAISYFNNALQIKSAEDENKVRALMGKGSTYYRKKLFIEGRYRAGAYRISMDTDWEVSDKKIEEYKKEDSKKSYIKMAYECFSNAAELDRSHAEAWYSKGHMEILMNKIKDAVQSFDNVLNISKEYENKENIPLFDKNLLFQYNTVATWADKDDFRASFYVPKLDLYIDHHPYDYLKEYQKVMKTKIKQYEKHKKKHIYISSEDEKNIEDTIKLKMKPYAIL